MYDGKERENIKANAQQQHLRNRADGSNLDIKSLPSIIDDIVNSKNKALDMSEINKLDWKKYEAITKYIYETLGSTSGVKIDGFGPNCKIVGKSGVAHQIDVLTSQYDGINSHRTAIECKFWNKKINKDIVMKVSEIIEDTKISKGIIVCKSGFTKDASEFARHKNIELVELNESGKKNADGERGKIEIGVIELQQSCTIHRPEILNIDIDYIDEANSKKEEINIYSARIKLSNGDLIPFTKYTTAFQNELHEQNKLFESIKKSYAINDGILINKLTNTSSRINGVTFTGLLKRIDSNDNKKILLTDQVWLIMKKISEEKTFKITESGLIVGDKK